MQALKSESSSTEGSAASSTAEQVSSTERQSHHASFAKVLDGRKQPIRGLWQRNERFYAQLKLEDALTGEKKTRRVPLVDKDGNPVKSRAEAVAEMERLRVKRTDGELPVLRRTPLFNVYANEYIKFLDSGAKKASTMSKEKSTLDKWSEKIGFLRLDQIKRAHVNRFIEERLEAKMSPRTVNLDVIAFRQVMKRAMADGWIQRLPTEGLRPLKTKTVKRQLITTEEFETICKKAFGKKKDDSGNVVPLTKNAPQLVDFLRFMAYSGARRNEALAMRWDDVDLENKQLTIGSAGDTKNSKPRIVDFNPKLEAHVRGMKKRMRGVSEFLFPSPQRGNKDVRSRSLQGSLMLVRERAEMPHFTFHDCRHHFISMAVMSGVDFMTIASWVGHQDGGVLIGKVYGHLANEHKKAMAEKLNFGPVDHEKPKAKNKKR
jgi:integrase